MKIMALDLGDSRIGIAFSDIMNIIANGYETYNRQKNYKDFEYIANLVKDHKVQNVVIGLPVNMDGTEGERALMAREFGNELKKLIADDVEINFIDERMTTISAERVLLEADVSRNKRKKVIDKIAATIILQSYLDIINK